MQDDMKYYDNVLAALNYIKNIAGDFKPQTAIVLGSGLGDVAEKIKLHKTIDTKDIPYWPLSTAPGHDGKVIMGFIEGHPVVILKGRVHYYEGYSMRDVTFSTRVIGMWGVKHYIGTNASGGSNHALNPGDIVVLHDHINLMGDNPLKGPSEPRWNVRFPDMTYAYSPRLNKLMELASLASGVHVNRGIYAAFSGPSYETPAEVRMARMLGADVVGMSTVPEVIVSNAMGMETAVLSCVANKAAGITSERLTEEEVLTAMKNASESVSNLLSAFIKLLKEGM